MFKYIRISLSVLAVAGLLTAALPTSRAQAQSTPLIIGGVVIGIGLLSLIFFSGSSSAGDSDPVSPS
jgi:hypothetical protein